MPTSGTGPLAGIDPIRAAGLHEPVRAALQPDLRRPGQGWAAAVAGRVADHPAAQGGPLLAPQAADVQALFKVALGAPKSPLTGECDWALSDPSKGDGALSLHVDRSQAGLAQDMVLAPQMTSLSGVGDSAKWGLAVGVDPLLIATKGAHGCELAVTGDLTQLNVATVTGIYTTITPSALPGFIQQLGGLCNKVFAGLGS